MIAQVRAEALRLLRAGRLGEAAAMFTRILGQAPHDAAALHGLGLARMAEGRAAEAVPLLRQALREEPGWAAAHHDLGAALQALGRADEAFGHFTRAAELRPDLAAAHHTLGGLLLARGQAEAAAEAFARAAGLQPGNAAAANGLGCALQALGQPEAARRAFAQAVAAEPGHVAAHVNLGNVLLELGELAAAEQSLARAVALAPGNTAAWRALGQTRRFDAAECAALAELAADGGGLDDCAQADLHFALAQALADSGRPEDSFAQLLTANRLVRGGLAYDEADTLGELAAIEAAFPAGRFAAAGGDPSGPVLVFGLPRSGTTLVEQILASHPAVFGAGELPDLDRAARRAGFPAEAGDDLLGRLGRDHLARLRQLGGDSARVVDKTPANIRFAGMMALGLPGARLIQVRRDPLDTALSCFATRFAAGQPFTYDLGELGRYIRATTALMDHWRRVLPAATLLEVEYEALVADAEGQARRLVAFCGLDWDPACLEFHRNPRPVRTASAAQVRRPITRDSVGRAQAYGEALRPLMDALGGIPKPNGQFGFGIGRH